MGSGFKANETRELYEKLKDDSTAKGYSVRYSALMKTISDGCKGNDPGFYERAQAYEKEDAKYEKMVVNECIENC